MTDVMVRRYNVERRNVDFYNFECRNVDRPNVDYGRDVEHLL
jgi:hypothetical protein